MPKRTSAVSHKPTLAIASEPRAGAGARPASLLSPVVTRITRDLEVIAPHGCRASVLFKLVDRDDGHRYYDWWLVVGRRGAETMSVKYKADGADTIRVDVPDGMRMSADALQPHVAAFLKSEGTLPAAPPTVRD
ncbi:MAG TPA: hypothetical protein VHT91_34095 [Kofleriaceae bacterium]|jgi:hypothetical protein|nr:hypothetical protein [Kofleriaceae bacterium]